MIRLACLLGHTFSFAAPQVDMTPLHVAVSCKQPEVARVLIDEYKADVNVRNERVCRLMLIGFVPLVLVEFLCVA